MSALHTPGPWWIEPYPYPHVRSDDGCVFANDYTTEANARLIAAAPDLLSTLQTARIQVVAFAISSIGAEAAVQAVAYIDAAIAKATTQSEVG